MDPCQLPGCLRIGIDPVAVHLGGINFYWYGLLVAIGFVTAVRLAMIAAAGEGLDEDQLLSALLVAALFGLLGARLFYILENNPGHYLDPAHLGEALSLWQGGLSFYGAIFGAALGAWIYGARYELPVLRLLDIGALAAPLGLAIGRLGNVVNGDIVGYATHGWGIEYTNTSNLLVPLRALGHTRQPAGIYEVVVEVALLGALFYLHRRRFLRPGQLAGLFLAGWATGQLLVQAFTDTPAVWDGLKAAQVAALPLVAGGGWLFLRAGRAVPARQAASKTA
jgi:phosphatidylglycerol:prolipoprotein diacylglycerol transferase